MIVILIKPERSKGESKDPRLPFFVLYQGTTSVAPKNAAQWKVGFSP